MIFIKQCNTALTATGFQEVGEPQFIWGKMIQERWTISGFLDHSEAGIIDEGWKFTFKVPGTAYVPGDPSLAALKTMYYMTAPSGGSGNLMQLTFTDPTRDSAVIQTAYFTNMGQPQWLTPYEFVVDCTFHKYQGG